MRPILRKIKPAGGISKTLLLVLMVAMPIAALILVRSDFIQLALSLVVLSKWRMLAIKPRFWVSNIRANSIDMMVGLSLVLFMDHAGLLWQLVWTAAYIAWLTLLKPRSDDVSVAGQAFLGQLLSLSALYLVWSGGPIYGLTALSGLFCYLAARHFIDSYDEPYAKLLAYIWGYFGAALAWLLSHWLLFYKQIAQPTLLITVIGYGLALLYLLDHKGKLSQALKRQFMFVMVAVVIIVLAFSDWGDKVV